MSRATPVHFSGHVTVTPNEVEPQPGARPYSTDSYLPESITALVGQALADIAYDAQEIERHQLAFNALATAGWHLARGNAPAALARMRRASTHIKMATAQVHP